MSPIDNRPLALEANHIWFAYPGQDWALRDVSLSVPTGRHTVIMGPSGTGKTTFLRVLAGLLTPHRGQVSVLGRPVHGIQPRQLSPLVGYIPQQLGLVRNRSALDNVLTGALGRLGDVKTLLNLFPPEEFDRARTALELMGIGHKSSEQVYRLSGGERQRVAIARTLLQRPRVVLADEFASDLDLALASEILSRIKRAAEREQLTFIMTMHRIGLARQFGDEVLALQDGALVPASIGNERLEIAQAEATL